MSNQTESKGNSKKLLTAKEEDVCQQISALEESLASQRAKALLALNEGVTHAIASDRSGLTLGQISYLVTAFNKKHLDVFPDDVLNNVQSPEKAKGKGKAKQKEKEEEKKKAKKKKGKAGKGKKAKKEKKKGKGKKDKKSKSKKSKKRKEDKKKKKGKKK